MKVKISQLSVDNNLFQMGFFNKDVVVTTKYKKNITKITLV